MDGCKINDVANISIFDLYANKSNFKHSIHDIIDYNTDKSLYDDLFYHSKTYFYNHIKDIIEKRLLYTSYKSHMLLPIDIICYEKEDYYRLEKEISIISSMGYGMKAIKLNSSTEIDIIYEIESYIDPCYDSKTDNVQLQYL